MRHFQFIDAMRWFAATAVVLFHINETAEYPSSLYQTVVGHGWLGVPVFFVISGFVVQESASRSPNWIEFLSRRFWRIYPPYLGSVLLVLMVALATKVGTGTNDVTEIPRSVSDWVATLTLTTAPVTQVPTINWVYWSLSYEAAFYLLLAFIGALPKLRWFLLFLVTSGALSGIKLPLFFLDNWSQFALGIAIAHIRHRLDWKPTLLGAACIADLMIHRPISVALTTLAAGAAISVCIRREGRWLNGGSIFSAAGAWSYSLYLTHVPVGLYILARLNPLSPATAPGDLARHIVSDLIMVSLCTAFAYLFWRLLEEPSARGFRQRREPVPPASQGAAGGGPSDT